MQSVSISKARDNLPQLVNQVATTRQPITLLRYGRPLAVLSPIIVDVDSKNPYPLRKIKIAMRDDFNKPLDEMWEACQVAESNSESCGEKNQK